MRRLVAAVTLLAAFGCGGGGSQGPTAPTPTQVTESWQWVFQNNVGGGGCQSSGRPCFEATWVVKTSGMVNVKTTWLDYTHSALMQGFLKDWVSVSLMKNGTTIASGSTTASYPDDNGTVVTLTQPVDPGTYTLRVLYFSYTLYRKTVTVQVDASHPG